MLKTRDFSVIYATRENLNEVVKQFGKYDPTYAMLDGYDLEAAKRFLHYMDDNKKDDVYYTRLENGSLMIIPYELGVGITTQITPLNPTKNTEYSPIGGEYSFDPSSKVYGFNK